MLEILQYDFLIRAGVAGLIIGLIAPMIGMFLVVRRFSLLADTLSHVSLAGVALGILIGWNPVLTAVATSALGSLGIQHLRRRRISGESVLAVFLSGSLALAVVMISMANGFNSSLFSVLFGSITTVSSNDLYWIIGLGALVTLLVTVLFHEFFLLAFNEELAQSQGMRVTLIDAVFMLMAAVTVAVSIQIIGVLLIGALMVVPCVAAMRYGRGFRSTLGIAIAFSLCSVIAGLIISYLYDLASGGTIVLIALLFFGISMLVTRKPRSNPASDGRGQIQ